MELKQYQVNVMRDLARYLELLRETGSAAEAYQRLWEEKDVPVDGAALPCYQDIIPGVPVMCFKVPTGGGKTFLACNAIRPIFDAMPSAKIKAVVWLVPSDAILSQTLKCLKSPGHPYRRQLERDFGARLEVYSKQELLNGQNFNPAAVTGQLSVMVLSYDSFRRHNKEGLKAYQENSAMMQFNSVLGSPETPVDGADEASLFQVINQLSPVVIVDESHHARGELSLEMLRNFNPCFVLDLTATPRKESNIISFVDAWQLKREQMVKIPVIVYNRESRSDVMAQAVTMRDRLEEAAVREQENGGQYIRPIVLFQAQPKAGEDSETFDKIKQSLIDDEKIPPEQIAIRTADINELKNVDLMSPECKVRYIITVNALKEGWDCPFAYILASLANRTSSVDVEQILGRVLRMPGARRSGSDMLNLSYVLTSSADFSSTVNQIVAGLNSAGFTEQDFRAPGVEQPVSEGKQHQRIETKSEQVNINFAAENEQERTGFVQAASQKSDAEEMLERAQAVSDDYEKEMAEAEKSMPDIPTEVRGRVKKYSVKKKFLNEVKNIILPQFFCKIPAPLFGGTDERLLDAVSLTEGFTLTGKNYDIDFGAVDEQMMRIDVEESGTPKAFRANSADKKYYHEWFDTLPPESKMEKCVQNIVKQLDKNDCLNSEELKKYVWNIAEGMNSARRELLWRDSSAYASKISEHINGLLVVHRKETFERWFQTERITCRPSWRFQMEIHPAAVSNLGGSLYESEEEMNGFENELIEKTAALDSVLWWHRNIDRGKNGFYINGFINHYPDFIVMTKAGKIVLVEAKGQYLKNDDSMNKIALGRKWAERAGGQYRYYMVFSGGDVPEDAYDAGNFLKIIGEL